MSNGETNEVFSLPYYLPRLKSTDEAVKILRDYINVDGTFLLRNSEKRVGYSLSLVLDKSVKHIKMNWDSGGYFLSGLKFGKIAELINYYHSHNVPNSERVNNVRLIHPITDNRMGLHIKLPGPQFRPLMVQHEPPPLPLETHCQNPYSSMYYSDVKQLDMDRTPELIENLKKSETCQCGLYIQDARLPSGWAVHLTSTAEQGDPHVFFVSPRHESSWVLPEEIKALLLPDQKRFLRQYMEL